MRVALITTLDHNPGDDFVRDGIVFLLQRCFPTMHFQFAKIHKHAPISARHGFGRCRRFQKYNALDRKLPLWLTRDRVLTADVLVQCGAPIYWCHPSVNAHCYENEWFEPLIKRRFSQNATARFLNIAGGSCQSYFSSGAELCEPCREYISELFDVASLTTLRDALAFDILKFTGNAAPVLPCPSLFVADAHTIKPTSGEFVVLNFMEIAGHYTFGQPIESDKWQKDFRIFYEKIKATIPIVFVCHDPHEKELARQIDPHARVFFSRHYVDYLAIYARARFGIVNRVHAALALAALGKPAFVIGNDSRARMVDAIGGSRYFVNDVTADVLLAHFEGMQQSEKSFFERIETLKKETLLNYVQLFSDALS